MRVRRALEALLHVVVWIADVALKWALGSMLVLAVWLPLGVFWKVKFSYPWLYVTVVFGAASVRSWNALFKELGYPNLILLGFSPKHVNKGLPGLDQANGEIKADVR